ncbi:hypothetical protein [Sphingomonas sp. NIC1]|uniref:hypothetical protein n=1 Tax=Sphingomonas sp. NIC1 TaxID=1961362 RepID=UPI0007C0F11F|nr:hypothetical protein [Sphingomonas sp. NIC1]ANC85446.1 hypothetical protein A7E77_00165 [Sphingomonas sp. NIC1]
MIELPYPHKALWPNGRPHFLTKSRETRKHRQWARAAALADRTRPEAFRQLVITVYPKPRGPLPDKDNASAAAKAYQDGIADAYGINDRDLAEPRIQFGERCQHGKFVIGFADDARPIGEIIKPIMARIAEQVER